MEPAGTQPGQPLLGVGDHRIATADVGPAAGVDVEREETAGLRRRRVEVAVAGDDDPRLVPLLDDLDRGAAPVALDAEHRPQARRPSVAASADGVKPSQNTLLVASDHGPRTATVVS